MVRPSTIHPIGFRHSPQTRNPLRGHENERCRALHERCNILEAEYNLRSLVNAIIWEVWPGQRPLREAKSLEACERPREPFRSMPILAKRGERC